MCLGGLTKAVAPEKEKSLAAPKDNVTSISALERQNGVGSKALTSCETPQLPVRKRKAEELSTSDGPSEPSSRRPAPGHLFCDGHAARAPRANELPRATGNSDRPRVGWPTLQW